MLLARNQEDFIARKDEGELLTCPPKFEENEIWFSRQYDSADGPKNADTPTHLIPFACTRWTNIYFPNQWAILGDAVGGPLRSVFGAGIRDVEVKSSGMINNTLLSHVHYWSGEGKEKRNKSKDPTRALISALRLDCLRGGRLP
jgi:hypothetical protein